MYSKDELLSKDISELEEIAEKVGAKIKSGETQEEIIYSILDKQAEIEGNKNPLGTKRRRVRIVKKDTDRVYSVNGKEGENFDLKKNKVQAETPSLFNDAPVTPPAKTRSRLRARLLLNRWLRLSSRRLFLLWKRLCLLNRKNSLSHCSLLLIM